MEIALRWLAENRPPSDRRTVVHGDFRTGNLLITPAGLGAVLDCELVALLIRLKTWAGCVAGHGDSARRCRSVGLVHGNISTLRTPARPESIRTPDAVAWWEMYATLRWAVICRIQAGRREELWRDSMREEFDEMLRRIGYRDESELAIAVRERRVDHEAEEMLAVIRYGAAARLAIANSRYAPGG